MSYWNLRLAVTLNFQIVLRFCLFAIGIRLHWIDRKQLILNDDKPVAMLVGVNMKMKIELIDWSESVGFYWNKFILE